MASARIILFIIIGISVCDVNDAKLSPSSGVLQTILQSICSYVTGNNNNNNGTIIIDNGQNGDNKTNTVLDYIIPTCEDAPPSCTKTRYRSFDGTCNNLQNPNWGAARQPFGQLVNDSSKESSLNSSLPNARKISLIIFPDKNITDVKWTLMTMQWGQIVAHDLTLANPFTLNNPNCCDSNGKLTSESSTNPVCAPILIPKIDLVNRADGTECIDFVRTTTSADIGCTSPGKLSYPINDNNAYFDLSLTYGANAEQAQELREGVGGRLLTTKRNGGIWPPQAANVTDTCPGVFTANEPCYEAGDVRVNQNPQLTALQIVLLKEHNRITDALSIVNKHWDDQKLYEEARRINIAQVQHINYYQYLPILLGRDEMISNKLIYENVTTYIDDYNPKISSTILREFATGAYRFFHTLIRGKLQEITENRDLERVIRLSDWFDRPLVLEQGNGFDGLVRGLTYQPQDKSDQFFNLEITQYLFRRNKTNGQDLRAIDIQRGRDQRVTNYVTVRAYCGFSKPKTFEDLLDDISLKNVELLKLLYKKVEDIDFVVGGAVERLVPGTLSGPTYLCILLKQFYLIRVGDRYFYENGADKDIAFTPSQLHTIRQNASLARMLCDNGINIKEMQPNVFLQISPENDIVPCDELPKINLELWKEEVNDQNQQ